MSVSHEPAPLSYQSSDSSQADPGSSPSAKETAKETASTAVDQASGVASSAADSAKQVASEAANQTKQVVAQAKDQVHSLAQQTRSELLTQADTKGQQAVTGLRTLSDQISALGDGRPGDAGPLVHYLTEAQTKVSSLASRIEQGGPQGVLDDVTAFARKRPGMFVLGAIGAGFLVGRVVRSGKAVASEQSESQPSYSSTRPALAAPMAAPAPVLDAPVLGAPVLGDPLLDAPVLPVDVAGDGIERLEPLS
jgi:vacuolar-type H+-ATPase subunit H